MIPLYSCLFYFILLPSPCSPIRILQTDPSPTATWRNFTRFLHAAKGRPVAGIAELKTYFHRFGYLQNDTVSLSDFFDKDLQSAVLKYQEYLGLPVTGKLDSTTISTIISPRCGVSDTLHRRHSAFNTTSRFAYFTGHPRWKRKTPMKLSYSFSPNHTIESLTQYEIRSAFQRAFLRWSAVIPVTFTEARSYHAADIKIGFYRGDHGDGVAFDGVLGILGHAFAPEGGRIHLDKSETWAVDFRKMRSKVAVDLESVATHEIGHVLGLGHSSLPGSVMYPSLSPRTKKLSLKLDDVEGIQALYGSNPNFTFGTLLQSENSSNGGTRSKTGSSANLWTGVIIAQLALLLY